MTGPVQGYMSLGFPQVTGRMVGSDAIFVWWEDGKPHAEDYYLNSKVEGCPSVCPDTKLGGNSSATRVNNFFAEANVD